MCEFIVANVPSVLNRRAQHKPVSILHGVFANLLGNPAIHEFALIAINIFGFVGLVKNVFFFDLLF